MCPTGQRTLHGARKTNRSLWAAVTHRHHDAGCWLLPPCLLAALAPLLVHIGRYIYAGDGRHPDAAVACACVRRGGARARGGQAGS